MGCIHTKPDYDLSQHYERLHHLDSGAVGDVYLERDRRTRELVAVKYIPRSKIDYHVRREVINFSLCQHSQVISFREIFLTKTHLAISMEYAEGGNLLDYINNRGPLSENQARWFWQQMIAGVDHCHFLDIVLRDLKPENTLIVGNKPGQRKRLLKLCDFGTSATDANGVLTRTAIGTLVYAAPEQLTNCEHLDGRKADIWSAGVILYCMLFAQHPFLTEEDARNLRYTPAYQRIVSCSYVIPDQPPVSDQLKDLLSKILVRDPVRRLTIAEIYRHPWFTARLPGDFFQRMGPLRKHAEQQRRNQPKWEAILAEAVRPA